MEPEPEEPEPEAALGPRRSKRQVGAPLPTAELGGGERVWVWGGRGAVCLPQASEVAPCWRARGLRRAAGSVAWSVLICASLQKNNLFGSLGAIFRHLFFGEGHNGTRLGRKRVLRLHSSPHIYVIQNFLTQKEVTSMCLLIEKKVLICYTPHQNL